MLNCESDSKGFLKEENANFLCSVNFNVIKIFSALKTDEERFGFVYSLPSVHARDLTRFANKKNVKDSDLGKTLKENGNKAFQDGDLLSALDLYNKSVQKFPWSEDMCSDLAVAVANRSAALYHLKHYQHALDDIQLALSLGYPQQLHYKVLERRARCLLATNQVADALEAFKTTLTCLDVAAKMTPDMRMKTEKDIQIMIAILTKNKQLENAPLPTSTDHVPALSGKASKTHQSASSAIVIEKSQQMGRYAVAKRNIAPGETVLVEQPYCAVLLAEFAPDHCTHCFKKLVSLVPCRRCCNVAFCSLACQEQALRSYHGCECAIMDVLWASGASVPSLMALRILSQRTPSYFLDIRPLLLQIDAGASTQKQYRGSDYTTVYQLVRHEDQRTQEDFFQRSAMAVVLFRCLQLGGYFGQSRASEDRTLTADEQFLGGLLLRHLQQLQFNIHAVLELPLGADAKLHRDESRMLGGALYPTLALFNHSCELNVVKYFSGTCVVVRTVKTVLAGEMVAETYGPNFMIVQRDERRRTLQEQYWFRCKCRPCEENWPLLKDLDPRFMRFRCGASSSCRAVILVPVDTPDFMVQCPSCGSYMNIMKGLKTLQETDKIVKAAMSLMGSVLTPAALIEFLEVLRLLDEALVPPFRGYQLCQWAVQRCMLTFGNING